MKLKEALPPKTKALVGNTLLGQEPEIAKLQRKELEPNTEWEQELRAGIESWTEVSTDELADYFLKNKKVFDQLAVEYPKLMQPPYGKLAYRGTQIKLNSVINAIETRDYKVAKIKNRYYIRFSKFPYTPYRPAQSWTINPKIATEFGVLSIWGNDASVAQVLYSTKVDDKFAFNPKLLAIIFGNDEGEIIRIDKKGEFDALISAKFLAERHLLHRLKGLRAYFEKARILWNTRQAPLTAKKSDGAYEVEDLMIPSWSTLDDVPGYISGLGPVGMYYKKVANKALKTLAKR